MNKEDLKNILKEYQEYEIALLEKEIADGAPRPIDDYSFSFDRFLNWLFELEES